MSTTLAKTLTKRQRLEMRLRSLKSIRSSWDTHWQDISDHLLPWAGRFFVQDVNRGGSRNNDIYDGEGTRALRAMAAGLMAGATSPSRPWFRVVTGDPDLNRYYAVRAWLDEVARRLMRVFQKSNTYRVLHGMYEELGAFGTACAFVLPDYDNVIHMYPLTAGEYSLAADFGGRVTTVFREFQRTVVEVVDEFNYDNCSQTTKNLYDLANYDAPVTMAQAVQPRRKRDPRQKNVKNLPFESIYWETGVPVDDPMDVLRESGFNHFPCVAPRWATTCGDVYGNGPSFDVIGDIKQLQHEQLRKADGIDQETNPALQVNGQVKGRGVQRLAGGITFMDLATQGANAGVRRLFERGFDLQPLLEDIRDVRERIRRGFFADLFVMFTDGGMGSEKMTAAEVAERHEEKLLMLGPVLERLHNELLSPLIDITFNRMLEVGALPPPPPELQGLDLSVEFVSVLAQAQRAIGVNAIDRFMGNVLANSEKLPDMLDRIDVDGWVDEYTDALGVPPRLIVSAEDAQEIRRARAKAKAAADQAAVIESQANAANKLANSPMDTNNALTQMDAVRQFSGVGEPPPAITGPVPAGV